MGADPKSGISAVWEVWLGIYGQKIHGMCVSYRIVLLNSHSDLMSVLAEIKSRVSRARLASPVIFSLTIATLRDFSSCRYS